MDDNHREALLRQMTRTRIANAIQTDLDGDEQIMKVVWEECYDKEELEVVQDEMRRIIARIQAKD